MDGPDHKASLNPEELKEMVQSIRNIEIALGNGIKCPNNSETETSKVVWKSIVAAEIIEKGSVFTEENLTVKRTGEGIPASLWDLVIGKKAKRTFMSDEVINIE